MTPANNSIAAAMEQGELAGLVAHVQCSDCNRSLPLPEWAEPGGLWRCYECGWGE